MKGAFLFFANARKFVYLITYQTSETKEHINESKQSTLGEG